MLVLRKDNAGRDAKDTAIGGHQQAFDVPTIFGIVDFGELLPNFTVGDHFGSAFENYSFIGLFGPNYDFRESGDVSRLARARASARFRRVTTNRKAVAIRPIQNWHEIESDYGVSFMRRRRSWKRGSGCNPSKMGWIFTITSPSSRAA